MTVEQAAAEYLRERIATREFSRTTAKTTYYTLREFTNHCPTLIAKVRRRHVVNWMEAQRDRTASTVASRYGTIRAFLRWANATGRITVDPAHGIKGPTRPRRNPRAFHPDDVVHALTTAPTTRLRVAMSLMVCEGLRISEVVGLQLGDIDWRAETVDVIGKGDKQRTVHLTPATAYAIRVYLREHPATAGPLIRSAHDDRSPITTTQLGRLISAHLANIGIKEFARDGRSPHAFRHSYCSDLVDAGLTMPEVADLAGHESVQTTMQYQRRVDMERTRGAVVGRSYAAALMPVRQIHPEAV